MADQKRSPVLSEDPWSETERPYRQQESPPHEQRQRDGGHMRGRFPLRAALRKRFALHTQKQMKQSGPVSRRNLIRGGIIASLVILLSATALVCYRFIVMQSDITAFKVGKQQNVTEYIGGGGIAYAHQEFDLSYPIQERAMNVLVKAGDQVQANEPLIKLDATQLNIQLTQASNNLSAAQAYLNSVAGATPYNPITVAAAQQAVQVAQSRYNALVAQTSSTTLRDGNLISPIAGVVTAVNINPGEMFAANAVLMTIMDQSSIIIRAKIPLENLRSITIGMPANVTPSALPSLTLAGKVSSIIEQADPQTDTFQVWVEVPNPQQSILPGMSAFVRIQGQERAFAVPRIAVLNPDNQSSVFIVRNGHAYIQGVHVIGRSENDIFIDAGITANDTIIMLPLDKMLRDGQPIHVTQTES